MTVVSSDMTLAINDALERVALNPSLVNQLLSNPYQFLTAQGVALPPPPKDPNGNSMADQYNASFQDLLQGGGGTKRSWAMTWSDGPNSVACWGCVIGVNALIWTAITTATVAAVVATDGAALAPILGEALALPAEAGAGLTIPLLSQIAGQAARELAASSPFGVAMVGTFVNMLANAVCLWIPHCCNDGTAPDNGMWGGSTMMKDMTMLSPTAAVTGSGTPAIVVAYQDNNTSSPKLWVRTWSGIPNWGKSFSEPRSLSNPTNKKDLLTASSPASVGVGPELYLLYVDADPTSASYGSLTYVFSTDGGATWSAPTSLSINTPAVPLSATAVGSSVFVAYRNPANNGVLISKFTAGGGLTPVTVDSALTVSGAQVTAACDPGLGCFNGGVYVGYTTSEGPGLRYVVSTDGGQTWSAEVWLPSQVMGGRPSFAAAGSQLMYLTQSPTDNHLCYSTTSDGATWTPQYRQGGNASDGPPALVASGSTWFAFFKGTGGRNLFHAGTLTS